MDATAQRHRDGCHHRGDARAAVGIDNQVARGVDCAALDQRRGRTRDRIERQRTCATDGYTIGAQAQSSAHRGSRHHRTDARSRNTELAILVAQLPGLAADVRYLPTLPSLDHRDPQRRLNQRPTVDIAIVFSGERHLATVFTNELVNVAALAAKGIVRCQADGVALEQFAGVVRDDLPPRLVGVVLKREVDLLLVTGDEPINLAAHHACFITRTTRSQPGRRVSDADTLALYKVLLACVAAEVPGHAVGRGVHRSAI